MLRLLGFFSLLLANFSCKEKIGENEMEGQRGRYIAPLLIAMVAFWCFIFSNQELSATSRKYNSEMLVIFGFNMPKTTTCELCDRCLPLTFHHLIPKKMHNRGYVKSMFSKEETQNLGLYLCKDCHGTIHRTLDHKTLALNYNTKEALLQHPEIKRFVTWVGRQTRKVKR